MKKVFLAMAAVAMALTSCSNEELETVAQNDVNFNICVEVEGQTRAVKDAWDNNDVIFIQNNMYPADFYLTYDKATSSWTPSTEFSTMTADEWNYNYNITSWGAVWTRNEGASRVENYVSLSSETSDGQETLVSKEGTMISFDTETFTWNIKLVMGQPEGFCKVTVEGLNDENYYLQVTGAQTTAEMKYTNNLGSAN